MRTFDRAHIGENAGSSGRVVVSEDAQWEYSGDQLSGGTDADLYVGSLGDGTLEITGGGRVISTATTVPIVNYIGAFVGGTGVVRVAGEGSLWDADGAGVGDITVGGEGNGTLEITASGAVQADDLTIGDRPDSIGTVTVTTSGSLAVDKTLVGTEGRGKLEITDGGHVQSSGVEVSGGSVSNPSVLTVDGPGSRLDQSAFLELGGESIMTISGGGQVIGCSLEGGTLRAPTIQFQHRPQPTQSSRGLPVRCTSGGSAATW